MSCRTFRLTVLALAAALAAAGPATAGSRPVTWEDLMRFRAIDDPVIAKDGSVIAFSASPDRGDGEGVVLRRADTTAFRVPRGSSPLISSNARWVAFTIAATLEAREKAGKDKPKPGLAVVDVTSGAILEAEFVRRFAFSDDSRWIAWLHEPDESKEKAGKAEDEATPKDQKEEGKSSKKEKLDGGVLVLRALTRGSQVEIPDVAVFAFDPSGAYVACVRRRAGGEGNAIFVVDLHDPDLAEVPVRVETNLQAERLAWTRKGSTLAFSAGIGSDKDDQPAASATVWVWDGASRSLAAAPDPKNPPEGWSIPVKTELSWSRDDQRLFFGWRPVSGETSDDHGDEEHEAPFDPYNLAAIRAKAEVDVWHWNDPRIVSNQKSTWDEEKDRVYRAVFLTDSGSVTVLGGATLPEVAVPEDGPFALGWSMEPYLKQMTWGGRYRDLYAVRISDGARTRIAEKVRGRSSLSPGGRFIAYFDGGHWYLADAASGESRDLTGGLGVAFDDEENDEPQPAAPYGLAGWIDGDRAVLLYDRFDVWEIPTDGGPSLNLSGGEGRRLGLRLRVEDLDPEHEAFGVHETLLLSAYHEKEKNFGFYRATEGEIGLHRLIDEKKRFAFVAKAEEAPVVLYTRESFEEFPDLWIADLDFSRPHRISDVNPQMAELAWGSAELVSWRSLGGGALDGVLIKPAGYREGQAYPLLVYFYERMSDRLYSFNHPVVNHRPAFSLYASDGYAVFLPDVVYEAGRPGLSATRCVVPGVLELVRRGIADRDRLGLHGHSWGGYETAFIVTQTGLFDAAIAGAPVSNMTSAYGGIRYETGLARQFQYEESQSRLGASLWEDPVAYWENSPLFFANRITTPLLIEFGDADGAVPWTQGIELYLAMRRLGKDCVMLTYRGEPHHVKKYPNKLDYAMKMKEYLDHYLKGAPAPAWITEGVAYSGK